MKNVCKIIPIIFSLFICACVSSEQVLRPIRYEKKLTTHVNKNVYLKWRPGFIQKGEITPLYVAPNIGGIIAAPLLVKQRENNPSRYYFSYDKAQQVAFMTYFRDALIQQKAFREIKLVTATKPLADQDVLITVYFKSTRVADYRRDWRVMLNVEMTIQTKKSIFSRHYLLESDVGGAFSGKGYYQQRQEVSERLLNQLMRTIEQWAHQTKG